MENFLKPIVVAIALWLAAPGSAEAQWQVRTQVDDFTGAKSSWATVAGRGGEYDPPYGAAPYLGLQCDDTGPALYFETRSTFLNSGGDAIPGMVKVDDRETAEVRFTANGEGTGGSFRPAFRSVDLFWKVIQDLREGRVAKLRVRDFRGVSYDYEFSLSGSTHAMNSMGCFSEPEAPGRAPVEVGERVEIGTGRGVNARLYRSARTTGGWSDIPRSFTCVPGVEAVVKADQGDMVQIELTESGEVGWVRRTEICGKGG